MRHPEARDTSNKSLLWINLREEPVIFINGRPFVLREASSPFVNISTHRGMRWKRVLDLERRLKLDVLAEARANNGNILVHDEFSDNNLQGRALPCWESIRGPADVLTTAEAFDKLKKEGYRVEYRRVPVTPESYFTMTHISNIQSYLRDIIQTGGNNFVMFNCQMGSGRSTFGTIFATLLGVGAQMWSVEEIIARSQYQRHVNHGRPVRGLHSTHGLERFRNGEYRVILKLLRLLENGREAKRLADAAIDLCGSILNIRDKLLQARLKMEQAVSVEKRAYHLRTTVGLLRRYFLCICLSAYVLQIGDWVSPADGVEAPADTESPPCFAAWMKQRPELGKVMETWVTDSTSEVNGEARLNFASILRSFVPVMSHDPQTLHIASRMGTVVGVNTILLQEIRREDAHYGSFLHGASNWQFEEDIGQGVASVAQPTISEIGTVLQVMWSKTKKVLWVNLREEPVIYINNIPVVLREQDTPLIRLTEFDVGLTWQKIKSISKRMKEDCIAEAEQHGKLLVHRQIQSQGGDTTLQGFWINRDELVIKTMSEVFNELTAGTPNLLEYWNVPCHPEKTLHESNFDRLTELADKGQESLLVFNSGPPSTATAGKGRYRGTAAMTLVAITLTLQECLNLDDVKVQSRKQFRAIIALIRILRNGREMQKVVDRAIQRCGVACNHRDQLYGAVENWEQSTHPEDQLDTCLSRFYLYANLICYATYINERTHAQNNQLEWKLKTFSEWLNAKPEILRWRDTIEENPEDALQRDDEDTTDHKGIFELRHMTNNVLVSQTILKMDLWPTLLRQARQSYTGGPYAINWRYMPVVCVAGLGMPKTEVMCNVLNYLYEQFPDHATGDPSSAGPKPLPRAKEVKNAAESAEKLDAHPMNVKWFNLRGEPIVYVKGRPTVLRDLHNPYENVDYSGMNNKRIEANELQLKQDAVKELSKTGGLLIHDEDATLNLCSEFHEVEEDDVETCAEAYQRVFDEFALMLPKGQINVEYCRVPMTDEQAPDPEQIDFFIDEFEKSQGKPTHFLFNCQMGRGRTTTGIVVYMLWNISKGRIRIEDLKAHPDCTEIPENVESEYWEGEYQDVIQLRRVLTNGSKGKEILDRVLNHADHVQNLRQAIIKTHLRAEQQVKKDKKEHYGQVAQQYLERYVGLITVSAYFLENPDRKRTYAAWLNKRQDVVHLLSHCKIDVSPGGAAVTRSTSLLPMVATFG